MDKVLEILFLTMLLYLFFFFLMFLFIFERETAWVEEEQREREGDIESEAGSRLWAVSTEPDTELELMNCEIMTWAEVGRLTNWATQTPLHLFSVLFFV